LYHAFLIYLSLFYFYSYGVPHDLHSFPTRRSSDLEVFDLNILRVVERITVKTTDFSLRLAFVFQVKLQQRSIEIAAQQLRFIQRSEEHTSELQSRGHLVCRLLLEKKKKEKSPEIKK